MALVTVSGRKLRVVVHRHVIPAASAPPQDRQLSCAAGRARLSRHGAQTWPSQMPVLSYRQSAQRPQPFIYRTESSGS